MAIEFKEKPGILTEHLPDHGINDAGLPLSTSGSMQGETREDPATNVLNATLPQIPEARRVDKGSKQASPYEVSLRTLMQTLFSSAERTNQEHLKDLLSAHEDSTSGIYRALKVLTKSLTEGQPGKRFYPIDPLYYVVPLQETYKDNNGLQLQLEVSFLDEDSPQERLVMKLIKEHGDQDQVFPHKEITIPANVDNFQSGQGIQAQSWVNFNRAFPVDYLNFATFTPKSHPAEYMQILQEMGEILYSKSIRQNHIDESR